MVFLAACIPFQQPPARNFLVQGTLAPRPCSEHPDLRRRDRDHDDHEDVARKTAEADRMAEAGEHKIAHIEAGEHKIARIEAGEHRIARIEAGEHRIARIEVVASHRIARIEVVASHKIAHTEAVVSHKLARIEAVALHTVARIEAVASHTVARIEAVAWLAHKAAEHKLAGVERMALVQRCIDPLNCTVA